MEARGRRELIERRVLTDGEATFKLLALEFGVSEMTVRRDLEYLEGRGSLRRVLGGAIATTQSTPEPKVNSRTLADAREKLNIASAVVGFIEPGETVVLDSGSTALAVARALVGRGLGLTILTASVLVAMELHDEPDTNILMTGGQVRPGELSLVGSDCISTFGRYNCDVYVMGVAGVDLDRGITEYSPDEAAVKRAAMTASKRTIVVADAGKLGRCQLTTVAQVSDVDLVVTDAPEQHPDVVVLRNAGIEVRCISE